ncbi:MAG: hypothetical protein GEU79_18490 [Acidimicrobiia bacterium]|nr:hypothetical protein [Acidimicrobiia bacterium]
MGKGTGRIAESWEIADLPEGTAPHVDDPRTKVRSGPLEGRSLHDLIDRYGSDFLGSADPTGEGNFPLLVKLLDAHQHLSVQVHPHRDYVADHPEARLKTESWYVIGAEPDSSLFLDVIDGTDIEMARRAVSSGNVRPILGERPAETGAFHHLPAGMLHALGAGVLVAEVQTPSDTTFRVDDWPDLYDRPERELHLEEAAETLLVDPPGSIDLPASPRMGSRKLVTTDHYWIAEHSQTGGLADLGTQRELRVLMVVAGTAMVAGISHSMGTTIVVPASVASTLDIQIDGALLEVGLVS